MKPKLCGTVSLSKYLKRWCLPHILSFLFSMRASVSPRCHLVHFCFLLLRLMFLRWKCSPPENIGLRFFLSFGLFHNDDGRLWNVNETVCKMHQKLADAVLMAMHVSVSVNPECISDLATCILILEPIYYLLLQNLFVWYECLIKMNGDPKLSPVPQITQ